MNFSIRYYRGCRVLTKADEIIIKYKKKKTLKLLDFVKAWESKRIILDITELENIEENLEIFKAAQKLHPSIAIMLLYKQYTEDIKAAGVPFFFFDGVNSLDDLTGQINLGVSDVYILNELCFNLETISKLCHRNNILVRVYPNVAQSSSKFEVDKFSKFFIRPDDIGLYEGYIDVLEFYGKLDNQAVLYDIYKDERWLGNLNDVVIGLDQEIDNKTVVPYFGEARIRCQKRCTFGRCDVCGSIQDLSKTLKEKNLGLIKGKAKHERKSDEENMSNESASTIDDVEEVSI